jgi:hypothetical protein
VVIEIYNGKGAAGVATEGHPYRTFVQRSRGYGVVVEGFTTTAGIF